MVVKTIYTLSNSKIIYSNDDGSFIEFTLAKSMQGIDLREMESLLIGNGELARNLVNITEPFIVELTMNEISEEDRDILSEAHKNFDSSGIISLTQKSYNSSRVRTTTWTNAVPKRNENFNMELAESIKSKRVMLIFECAQPTIREN